MAMAVMTRYKNAVGVGTLAAFILVLVFGSPWYADWARDHTDPDTAGGWFLRLLAWPAWAFSPEASVQDIIASGLRALFLLLFTALFLYMLPGSQLARARGTLSQFFAGWGSYIFAGAFAALLTTLVRANPTLLGAFQSAGAGATYGFFTGWIIGLAALGGWRGTR
jgi:hypothetical protein